MTLNKMQFVALMLLTATLVGVGVGWLPRFILPSNKTESRKPIAVMSPVPSSEIPSNESSKQPDAFKQSPLASDKAPVLYQGKPASVWLAQFHDCDPDYRIKAIDPLAALAVQDRSVIAALIGGLKDKDEKVLESIASSLEHLNPPVAETASALFHSGLGLSSVLFSLKKIDPKGSVTIPLAQAAMKDRQLRVRAGFTLIAFDHQAKLPIPLLVEALKESDDIRYYFLKEKEESYCICSQQLLAVWLLRQAGVEAKEATPFLVNTLRWIKDNEYDVFFTEVVKTKNRDEWLTATLIRMDPDGANAVPLLMKFLEDPEPSYRSPILVLRALGRYGEKARVAIPALREIVKNKGVIQRVSTHPSGFTSSNSWGTEARPTLSEVALEALQKIDPKAANLKERAPAESSKPATKN